MVEAAVHTSDSEDECNETYRPAEDHIPTFVSSFDKHSSVAGLGILEFR